MIVKMSDKCTFCKESLLLRPFYAFLCRHFVHKSCVERYLIQNEFSQVNIYFLRLKFYFLLFN